MTAIGRQLKDQTRELQPPGWPRLVLKIMGGLERFHGSLEMFFVKDAIDGAIKMLGKRGVVTW